MSQAPDIFSSARELLEHISSGKVSASDMLEAHLARYEQANPTINAVVRTDLAAARAQARELDRVLKAGERAGPLHGLPMTVKDTFDVEGYKHHEIGTLLEISAGTSKAQLHRARMMLRRYLNSAR